MVLHGKGNQKFLTKSYEEDRQKALEDRTRYTNEELADLGITQGQGGGKTNHKKFEVWQWPFPTQNKIRRRKKVDLRSKPQVGDW